ncbi:MAG: DUF3800 domain-containing protein [Archangium sp.]
MFLLYVDESGSPEDLAQPFVVGGVAVEITEVESLRRDVEAIVAKHLDPHLRKLELHATELLGGRNAWRGIPGPVRGAVVDDLAALLGKRVTHRRLFAVARSPGAVNHVDPLERVFEELLLRFSSFLKFRNAHGLVIADEAKYENTLQPLAGRWRETGTRFGRLTNVAEVPLFVDSKATRLIQLADFVAHGVFRHYRGGDDKLLKPLLPGFDSSRGILHGLTHLTVDRDGCVCPACRTRKHTKAVAVRGGRTIRRGT